ncbi:unnamed protein product, partial [Polarella glacialis]
AMLAGPYQGAACVLHDAVAKAMLAGPWLPALVVAATRWPLLEMLAAVELHVLRPLVTGLVAAGADVGWLQEAKVQLEDDCLAIMPKDYLDEVTVPLRRVAHFIWIAADKEAAVHPFSCFGSVSEELIRLSIFAAQSSFRSWFQMSFPVIRSTSNES